MLLNLCMHSYICVCVYVHACMYMCLCVYLLVSVCVYGCMCVCCRGQFSKTPSLLPPCVTGDWTRVIRFSRKHLYLLDHFNGFDFNVNLLIASDINLLHAYWLIFFWDVFNVLPIFFMGLSPYWVENVVSRSYITFF